MRGVLISSFSLVAAVALGAGLFVMPTGDASPSLSARIAVRPAQYTPLGTTHRYLRLAFDSDKCIESCDMQYSTCENNGNENGYCSQHHDACVAGCLSQQ
jgi:hypothetical protein